jgi:hypothetical protein
MYCENCGTILSIEKNVSFVCVRCFMNGFGNLYNIGRHIHRTSYIDIKSSNPLPDKEKINESSSSRTLYRLFIREYNPQPGRGEDE